MVVSSAWICSSLGIPVSKRLNMNNIEHHPPDNRWSLVAYHISRKTQVIGINQIFNHVLTRYLNIPKSILCFCIFLQVSQWMLTTVEVMLANFGKPQILRFIQKCFPDKKKHHFEGFFPWEDKGFINLSSCFNWFFIIRTKITIFSHGFSNAFPMGFPMFRSYSHRIWRGFSTFKRTEPRHAWRRNGCQAGGTWISERGHDEGFFKGKTWEKTWYINGILMVYGWYTNGDWWYTMWGPPVMWTLVYKAQ